MTKATPKYIIKLIKKYPLILSGRKNFIEHHRRILKNLNLTNKYIRKKD